MTNQHPTNMECHFLSILALCLLTTSLSVLSWHIVIHTTTSPSLLSIYTVPVIISLYTRVSLCFQITNNYYDILSCLIRTSPSTHGPQTTLVPRHSPPCSPWSGEWLELCCFLTSMSFMIMSGRNQGHSGWTLWADINFLSETASGVSRYPSPYRTLLSITLKLIFPFFYRTTRPLIPPGLTSLQPRSPSQRPNMSSELALLPFIPCKNSTTMWLCSWLMIGSIAMMRYVFLPHTLTIIN